MSNITIQPYGTGAVPSTNVGIVNDLVTGGADKALAAQQGVVIGSYLFDRFVPADLSGVIVSNYSLGSSGWNGTGKHCVYPVTPGQVVRLTVASAAAQGGWYGFFKDTYTVPSSTSDMVPYVSGTGRNWLTAGTKDVTIPNNCAYLVYCPKDGDGNNSTWSLAIKSIAGIKSDFVPVDSPLLQANIGEMVDVPSIAAANYTLGSTGWILGGSGSGKHKVVEVTGGQKIKVRATNSSGGGNFRAFLTSSYVPPTGTGSIPYCANTSRVWQNDASDWVELIAPATAAYLCLVVTNGDGDTTLWEVEKFTDVPVNEAIEDYTLKKEDVVNNVNDGGDDVPLSATQGKLLAEKISDGMPVGLTKYAYTGPIVKVGDTHYVARKKVTTITSIACQGGACYGDYLFMFTADNTTCWIYNLATGTRLQTYTIPEEQRGFVSDCHANTVNFGTEKYDADDPFPLIYVSTGYTSGGYSGALVYRIVATTETVDEVETTTYSLVLVQTIKMPSTEALGSWTEFVTGDDGDCYVCYTSKRRILRMKMPTLSQGDVTLDPADAIEVYQFTPQPSSWDGSRNQNRMYHGGKIYMVSGVPASNEKSLFVVLDLATRKREVVIDLETLGLTSEPETCFIWNGHITIVFRSNSNVYSLYFD